MTDNQQQHPDRVTLELLHNRQLRGEELLAALDHVETCETCRAHLTPPAGGEEILKRFQEEPSLDTEKTAFTNPKG